MNLIEILQTKKYKTDKHTKHTYIQDFYENNFVKYQQSNLNFSQNNIKLINSNSITKYKGQLLIYTKILNINQLYQSKCAFIIGKNNEIGVINYSEYDLEYNNKRF